MQGGEATSRSDIDFHVARVQLVNLLDLGGLYCDLEDRLLKKADVLTTQMLTGKILDSIRSEEILTYARD